MLGPPIDSPALHAGLVVAAAAFLAVAGSLPASPAPDAAGVADTVDRVAVGEASTAANDDHAADRVRIRPTGIAMRNDGATARATFAFGPVVPVRDGPLRAVLEGESPEAVFDDHAGFIDAVETATERKPRWVRSDRIAVRGVSWDGDRVTLVGA
ncbi:DUF7283 family protein [Halolamina salifodinae]|uniref:Uncharacterized protein n=1 Tax=Halolamina salifodinae TaxID=1202767 RepID=A0A8T4GV66_9EURY|nr:hypothetical protein [Halolamina salifodinae]MBP1985584.1 hypothetical protein [Halolamina salifodinae]